MSTSNNDNKDNSSDLLSFETWRRKAAAVTGLGLSPEEVKKRDEIKQLQRESSDWEQCEKWKNQLWHTSAFLFKIYHAKPRKKVCY